MFPRCMQAPSCHGHMLAPPCGRRAGQARPQPGADARGPAAGISLPPLSAALATRLAEKAERFSDPATGSADFWAAVKEASWRLPPHWAAPAPAALARSTASRGLSERIARALPAGARWTVSQAGAARGCPACACVSSGMRMHAHRLGKQATSPASGIVLWGPLAWGAAAPLRSPASPVQAALRFCSSSAHALDDKPGGRRFSRPHSVRVTCAPCSHAQAAALMTCPLAATRRAGCLRTLRLPPSPPQSPPPRPPSRRPRPQAQSRRPQARSLPLRAQSLRPRPRAQSLPLMARSRRPRAQSPPLLAPSLRRQPRAQSPPPRAPSPRPQARSLPQPLRAQSLRLLAQSPPQARSLLRRPRAQSLPLRAQSLRPQAQSLQQRRPRARSRPLPALSPPPLAPSLPRQPRVRSPPRRAQSPRRPAPSLLRQAQSRPPPAPSPPPLGPSRPRPPRRQRSRPRRPRPATRAWRAKPRSPPPRPPSPLRPRRRSLRPLRARPPAERRPALHTPWL